MTRPYHAVLTWLEIHSRWSKLRELGQSGLVRASVLMPVFGYLLLLNDTVQQYLTIRYDPAWPFNYLPSLWRVWMFYYGSCFLAVGSMIFASRCPAEIKQYASAFSMADAQRPHYTAHQRTKEIADTLSKLYARMSKWEHSIFEWPRLRPELPNLGAGTSPELQTSDQWGLGLIHIWTLNDIRRPKSRIAAYLFLWAGLVLLSIPALATFVQVTRVLVTHLYS
jgi:hypothetical protein